MDREKMMKKYLPQLAQEPCVVCRGIGKENKRIRKYYVKR